MLNVNLISENEKDFFIKINNEYDFLYEFCINEIIKEINEPIENLSFAEIGSNTGITLLKLCEKGAKNVMDMIGQIIPNLCLV